MEHDKAVPLSQLLQNTKWEGQPIEWFPADWSTRNYGRVKTSNGQSAIILDSPPDSSPDSMIGHQIGEWYRLNKFFASADINVPEIYAADLENGLILMQDFGTTPIAENNIDAYKEAVGVLIKMREAHVTEFTEYKNTHVYKALRFFPEFIIKDENLTEEWFSMWENIETALPPCPQVLTHIDFQAANLMWMPQNPAGERIGVIDFQAACRGPFVYDMVNLLEDARRILPDDIKAECISQYCYNLSEDDKNTFEEWFPVITVQFHCRVAGQILKLATLNDRNDLLKFYNNLINRIKQNSEHKNLILFNQFIAKHGGSAFG